VEDKDIPVSNPASFKSIAGGWIIEPFEWDAEQYDDALVSGRTARQKEMEKHERAKVDYQGDLTNAITQWPDGQSAEQVRQAVEEHQRKAQQDRGGHRGDGQDRILGRIVPESEGGVRTPGPQFGSDTSGGGKEKQER